MPCWLTLSVCSAESLMMNCWSQKWEEPYLLGAKQLSSHWLRRVSIFPHSQTHNVRVSRDRVTECSEHCEDRQRGQEENIQHIHRKTARGGLRDCKFQVSMFGFVIHGPLFVLMSSEGTLVCHVLHFECMPHGFVWLSGFSLSLCFQPSDSTIRLTIRFI